LPWAYLKEIKITEPMLPASIQKNDTRARIIIFSLSLFVFTAITVLSRVSIGSNLPFDIHIFAMINAIINSMVAILLVAGLRAVNRRNYLLHKKIMLTAMSLSVLFLISYIAHHLFAGETRFGDVDHNNVISDEERSAVGFVRVIYYILLLTHIPLAGIVLPFILFTAYRALTGEFERHKKLSRITWPIWFYVAISGVLVYLMIQPYYI
jgi:putative membrane protein